MPKHQRLRAFIIDYLTIRGTATVHDIHSEIWDKKWAPSVRSISGVLSSDSRFEPLPSGRGVDMYGYSYPILEWRLKHGQ